LISSILIVLIDIKYSELAQYKRILEWYQKLKIRVGDRACLRKIQEIVSNAQDSGYGWTCIDSIQDAWTKAISDSARNTVASKLKKCTTMGDSRKTRVCSKPNGSLEWRMNSWKSSEFQLVYFEGNSDTSAGCIAR
jgi:hypothetical protein